MTYSFLAAGMGQNKCIYGECNACIGLWWTVLCNEWSFVTCCKD
jgi:hypothetical protein